MSNAGTAEQFSPEKIEGYQLSQQQRRLWLSQDRERPFYWQCHCLLEGPLDREAFERVLLSTIERHEILRTRFQALPGMEIPVQVVESDATLNFHLTQLSGVAPIDQQKRIATALTEEAEAFAADLRKTNRLARFHLFILGEREHALIATLSSLIADRQSISILLREIAQGCSGPALGEDPVQYIDYAEWRRELLASDDAKTEREYWREFSAGPPHDARAFAPAVVNSELDRRLVQSLVEQSRAQEISFPALLLGCWQILLWRMTGEGVVVGTLSDGRRIEHLRDAIGPYEQVLPAPSRFKGDFKYGNFARSVERLLIDHRAHEEYFSDPEATAGFAYRFDFEEITDVDEVAGLRRRLSGLRSFGEGFLLKLSCARRAQDLELDLHYDASRYSEVEIRTLMRRFVTLLKSVADDPSTEIRDLNLIDDEEFQYLTAEVNSRGLAPVREACFHDLFAEQAARTPDAVAVIFNDRRISFGELNERANQLAHLLQRQGVGPETPVGLCLERSIEMLIGAIGIQKAGGCFVPFDPAQPRRRLSLMLAETGAPLLVSRRSIAATLPEEAGRMICLDDDDLIATESRENPISGADGSCAAYVIYTSGSTGTPKGAVIEHRSMINLADALRDGVYGGLVDPLRVSMNAPFVFDSSIKQMVQLLAGSALVIIPEETRLDGAGFLSYLEAEQVDVLDCTPSQLQLLINAGLLELLQTHPSTILSGGEALNASMWSSLCGQTEKKIFNLYGPTECTVDSTVHRLKAEDEAPTIGRPIANAQVYLADEGARLTPAGLEGELCIGGRGLGRGYLTSPGMTAAKFIPDSFGGAAGARLYRSGDRARLAPNGELQFSGRIDDQMKVSGVRIELGEIEAVLRGHPAVRDAVVAPREDAPGVVRLAAYLVPRRGRLHDPEDQARYRLPNGLMIACQNKNEAEYLHEEIFDKKIYLQRGIELPEDACVFDVGANIGMFSLFVAHHCPGARIYAFEPIAPIYKTLQFNNELCGLGARLFPVGLSGQSGEAQFTYYPRYSMMSGQSDYADAMGDIGVVKRYLSNQQRHGSREASALLESADQILPDRFAGESFRAEMKTLSAVIREQQIDRIDLLKIDVQRAELDVLHGLEDDDWAKIRQIVMEAHDEQGGPNEGRLRQITGLVESHGFVVVAEQDEIMEGTDRYNLYARRPTSAPNERRPTATARAPQPTGPMLSMYDLRNWLRERLPESMTPSAFVVMDKFPLTSNGKVDRRALPAPENHRPEIEERFVAPQTATARAIAAIWSETLGVDKVGIHDNFFELGGNSLLLVQVHTKLREAFKRDIAMVEIFQHPTIDALARHLGQEGAAPRSFQNAQHRANNQREARNRRKTRNNREGKTSE